MLWDQEGLNCLTSWTCTYCILGVDIRWGGPPSNRGRMTNDETPPVGVSSFSIRHLSQPRAPPPPPRPESDGPGQEATTTRARRALEKVLSR